MNINGLLKKTLFGLMALASLAYSHPVREKKAIYDRINRNGTDQSREQILEASNRAFGYLEHCPTTLKTDAKLPVSAQSTCPWYYEVSHKPNRYPATIRNAVTPCTDKCIGGNGDLKCLPVTRTIEVFNEMKEASGEIRYESEEIEITVGFSCGAHYMVENVPVATTTAATAEQIQEASKRAFGDLAQCPTTVKTNATLPVSAKSTCPWYYEISHRPNRYPATILNAVTPCTDKCIGGNGDLQCLPMTRTIDVFNDMEEASGEIRYESEEIEITVGFSCGARYMVENVPAATTISAPPANEKEEASGKANEKKEAPGVANEPISYARK